MHPYEKIPLNAAGFVLAAIIIALHLWMFLKQDESIAFFKKLPRNYFWGIIFMATGLVWFWLIIAHDKLSPLAMDLNDFNKLKSLLIIIVPVGGFLVIKEVREFLAVRGLGLVKLMAAMPLLASAWQEPHTFKFLIPIYAYAMITTGLFWVAMPYLFRDLIQWATGDKGRYKLLSLAGLAYGVLVLICSIFFWGSSAA